MPVSRSPGTKGPSTAGCSFGVSDMLDHAKTWLADDFVEHQVFPGTTPGKRGAIDCHRILFAASSTTRGGQPCHRSGNMG